jgi:hypothetical protein
MSAQRFVMVVGLRNVILMSGFLALPVVTWVASSETDHIMVDRWESDRCCLPASFVNMHVHWSIDYRDLPCYLSFE